MTSIIKVDQIQTVAGGAPTVADLGVTIALSDSAMPSWQCVANSQ